MSVFKHLHTIDMEKEKQYTKEYDQLFPFYLFCSAIICVAMMVTRFLTLFGSNTEHKWDSSGNITCYITLGIIAFSILLTYIMEHKV